jgi:hypothetical protein
MLSRAWPMARASRCCWSATRSAWPCWAMVRPSGRGRRAHHRRRGTGAKSRCGADMPFLSYQLSVPRSCQRRTYLQEARRCGQEQGGAFAGTRGELVQRHSGRGHLGHTAVGDVLALLGQGARRRGQRSGRREGARRDRVRIVLECVAARYRARATPLAVPHRIGAGAACRQVL